MTLGFVKEDELARRVRLNRDMAEMKLQGKDRGKWRQ